eukprot:TRINITY_DN9090_c0_g1_i17.p1 TRINITY_DN9090_c0_g1~~TRINITY_DN9090_c0_g1_i17.p1  ORF type:complete len:254 (-),score=-21.70 TRINITY_DN9090_c0_g1_i17:13-774(-)
MSNILKDSTNMHLFKIKIQCLDSCKQLKRITSLKREWLLCWQQFWCIFSHWCHLCKQLHKELQLGVNEQLGQIGIFGMGQYYMGCIHLYFEMSCMYVLHGIRRVIFTGEYQFKVRQKGVLLIIESYVLCLSYRKKVFSYLCIIIIKERNHQTIIFGQKILSTSNSRSASISWKVCIVGKYVHIINMQFQNLNEFSSTKKNRSSSIDQEICIFYLSFLKQSIAEIYVQMNLILSVFKQIWSKKCAQNCRQVYLR